MCSAAGSHAGSHGRERPSETSDLLEQRAETSARSRTDLNCSGHSHMELRVKRLGVAGKLQLCPYRSGKPEMEVKCAQASL
jgi:hypothetical protein